MVLFCCVLFLSVFFSATEHFFVPSRLTLQKVPLMGFPGPSPSGQESPALLPWEVWPHLLSRLVWERTWYPRPELLAF